MSEKQSKKKSDFSTIVFQVEHPNHGKIGVFDYETIIMTED